MNPSSSIRDKTLLRRLMAFSGRLIGSYLLLALGITPAISAASARLRSIADFLK